MQLKRLLVAFDGSPSAVKAFDTALDMAGICSGSVQEIYVVAVAQPPEPADLVEVDAILDGATEYFGKLFAELTEKAKDKPVTVTTEVLVGHPANQVVHYAAEKQCDLILIGQRGKSRVEEWLLGSVSKRVASYARCSVLIVK